MQEHKSFALSEITNMDQTPICFEFLGSKTYETKGSNTVWVKTAQSGWDKRQATIVHYKFCYMQMESFGATYC
jgi:hypothetical protein